MVFDLRNVADTIDRIPFTPARLAERALHDLAKRRRRRAQSDPRYAAIEARRDTGGPTRKFLSDDLTIADWEEQTRIARNITPDPWWVPAARRIKDLTASRALSEATHLHQRVTRGWSDADAWNAAWHLTTVTAAMLDQLADTAHGWPGNDEFPTFDTWVTALRANAANLRRFTNDPDERATQARWWALATDPDADPDQVEEAFTAHLDAEGAAKAAAADAMRWVADHLNHLWD